MMIMSINTSLYTVKRVNHQVLPQLPGPAFLMYQNAARSSGERGVKIHHECMLSYAACGETMK